MMQRLGDALMLLPRDIQEMIVDRLIAAITCTDSLKPPYPPALPIPAPVQVPVPPTPTPEEKQQDVPMPLAAATLAALLHHYSSQIQGKKTQSMEKSIPVIPVHA
jgi:hypothetical protein